MIEFRDLEFVDRPLQASSSDSALNVLILGMKKDECDNASGYVKTSVEVYAKY